MSGPGDGVTALQLPGVEAAYFGKACGPILREHYRRQGGIPRPVADVLQLLEEHGQAWWEQVARQHRTRGSDAPTPRGSDAGRLTWWSTATAAAHLGLTQRALVKAASQGRIAARRREHGRGWEFSEESVRRFIPRRTTTSHEQRPAGSDDRTASDPHPQRQAAA